MKEGIIRRLVCCASHCIPHSLLRKRGEGGKEKAIELVSTNTTSNVFYLITVRALRRSEEKEEAGTVSLPSKKISSLSCLKKGRGRRGDRKGVAPG